MLSRKKFPSGSRSTKCAKERIFASSKRAHECPAIGHQEQSKLWILATGIRSLKRNKILDSKNSPRRNLRINGGKLGGSFRGKVNLEVGRPNRMPGP